MARRFKPGQVGRAAAWARSRSAGRPHRGGARTLPLPCSRDSHTFRRHRRRRPRGLVAARYLRQAGFACTLFDQADGVGGQWRLGAPHSKVWPEMRTNSSRVMTAFSDLPHPPGTAVYPSAEQVGAYLARYAERSSSARCRRRRSA
jgi:hypothetical protein